MENTKGKKRILTGDNPTGQLHLGHYVGSLENRVKLQKEYETFILVADMHAFAYPKYVTDPQAVSDSILEVTIDNLAVGLDPTKVTFFNESAVPEIYELAIIFSMLVSHNLALRNPTIKEEIRDKALGDNYSLGFINYPTMQAADILCVKADAVPVGEDQEPHLELTREIARKFNNYYGNVFDEPKSVISKVRRLIGTDGGSKMTKSLGNTIYLGESEESLREKVMKMYTDPNRVHATDPGKVEGNPVFVYHDTFNPNKEEVDELKKRYLAGKVGDIEVKEKLFTALNTFLTPIREKRRYYESHKEEVRSLLSHGNKLVREISTQTLNEVKEKMKLSSF